MNSLLKGTVAAACLLAALGGVAHAGGLERGGYNIDLLFDPAQITGEMTGTYVMPSRKLDNVKDTDLSDGVGSDGIGGGKTDGVRETEDYFVPRLGLKVGIGQSVDCLVDYSQPWGAHTNPGRNWMGANDNIETKIESDNYGATCSYKFDAGKGKLRFIGGVFHQEVSGFKLRQVAPDFASVGDGTGKLELSGDGVGWRVGAAYEIPEIAFRASLVYNSKVDLGDISGTLDLSQYNGAVVPVFGQQSMPQSVELKFQSGIAPDWLAFGSIKWVDWSSFQIVSFCSTAIKAAGLDCQYQGPGFATSLDLLYRDGWTVSGGIGHKFNDQWSGAVSLTWDRGTTTGLSASTDTWTLGGGAAYTPSKNIELRFGGAVGLLTSGKVGPEYNGTDNSGTAVSYEFGNDIVTALSASLKVKW
jgi:long-chain fatty acid transport protein